MGIRDITRAIKTAAKDQGVELSKAVKDHLHDLINGTNAGHRDSQTAFEYARRLVAAAGRTSEEDALLCTFQELYNASQDEDEFDYESIHNPFSGNSEVITLEPPMDLGELVRAFWPAAWSVDYGPDVDVGAVIKWVGKPPSDRQEMEWWRGGISWSIQIGGDGRRNGRRLGGVSVELQMYNRDTENRLGKVTKLIIAVYFDDDTPVPEIRKVYDKARARIKDVLWIDVPKR